MVLITGAASKLLRLSSEATPINTGSASESSSKRRSSARAKREESVRGTLKSPSIRGQENEISDKFFFNFCCFMSNSNLEWDPSSFRVGDWPLIVMCPSASDSLRFGVDAFCTDEEIVLFLGGRNFGDPIPVNVITEVNPFSIEPWNSPDDMFYLYNSGDPQSHKGYSEVKETKAGYWKSKGGVSRIFTSSLMVGRKTTWEFYVGRPPFGNKTGWMMHEYQTEEKACQEIRIPQEYSSLCRVFWQNDESPNFEVEQSFVGEACTNDVDSELVEAMLLSLLEEEESRHTLQGETDKTQVVGEEEQQQLATSDRRAECPLHDETSDVNAMEALSKGEYIKLDDFYDMETSSSSSDNSSVMSMNSNEYFDADALLRDLEGTSGFDGLEEHTDSRFSISASVRSNQQLSRPPLSGSIDGSSNTLVVQECMSCVPISNNQPASAPSHSLSSIELQDSVETIASHTAQGDQANHPLVGDSHYKGNLGRPDSSSVGRIAKLGKRYCCFAPL